MNPRDLPPHHTDETGKPDPIVAVACDRIVDELREKKIEIVKQIIKDKYAEKERHAQQLKNFDNTIAEVLAAKTVYEVEAKFKLGGRW